MTIAHIPIVPGSKKPAGEWKRWQTEVASPDTVEGWINAGLLLGVVTGSVSDNLEVVDVDTASFFQPLQDKLNEYAPGLYDKLVVVATQKGFHLYYRAQDIGRNTKLASHSDGRVIFETRGEGGYVVCPSEHETRYRFVQGDFGSIPALSDAEREVLLSIARSFDQAGRVQRDPQSHARTGSPADDFNLQSDWESILEQRGWTLIRKRQHDGVCEWVRPGKSEGISATTGVGGTDLFYLFSSSVPGLEPGRGYTKFGFVTHTDFGGDYGRCAQWLLSEGFGQQKQQKDSVHTQLIAVASSLAYYTHGSLVYAVDTDGAAYPVQSERFLALLLRKLDEGTGVKARPSQLREAAEYVALLNNDAPVRPLWIRVGSSIDNRTLWIDTCSEDYSAVRVNSGGWSVTHPEDVSFRRSKAMLPLVMPVRGGRVDDIRPWVNIPDDRQWLLFISWILNCYNPTGLKPLLVLEGDASSGKTTLTTIARRLVDPSFGDTLIRPSSAAQIQQHAHHRYLLAYDNISQGLSPEVSDALCTLATGAGSAARKLYTDYDEALLVSKNPCVLNGIDDLIRREDMASRAVVISMQSLRTKGSLMADGTYWDTVTPLLPGVLGHIFDGLSAALKNSSTVTLPQVLGSRLADFTKWSAAAAPVFGWTEEQVFDALLENDKEMGMILRENNPVISEVMFFIEERGKWTGRVSDLFLELKQRIPRERITDFPPNTQIFGIRLKNATDELRRQGVEISKNVTRHGTMLTLEYTGGDE